VLEFTVAANSGYDAVVNAVAISMAGSANMTGDGAAKLYKSTDLVTALATETGVTATASGANSTTTFVDASGATEFVGIPMGANVRIYDDNVGAYMVASGGFKVTILAPTLITYTPLSVATASADKMYYRPMQPGAGKLFFGAQTTLTADVTTGAGSLAVTSSDGFAIGDTVKLTGFTSAGAAVTSGACVITGVPTGGLTLTIGGGGGCVTTGGVIAFDYLSNTTTTTPAITNYHNSAAKATTGLINTTGQVVAAGTSMTFVVKGDTTSEGTAAANLGAARTSSTLQASIAAVGDMTWTDKVNYGIATVTKNLPIIGNTLNYSY
jgi:hypothetical protein